MPENKRALHNAMERKRRDSIKVGNPKFFAFFRQDSLRFLRKTKKIRY
jgi:hypothetical protein